MRDRRKLNLSSRSRKASMNNKKKRVVMKLLNKFIHVDLKSEMSTYFQACRNIIKVLLMSEIQCGLCGIKKGLQRPLKKSNKTYVIRLALKQF